MHHKVDRTLDVGDGNFIYVDRISRRTLQVFYYRPPRFSFEDPILFVMHGVKRNAQAYRDSWRPNAHQYGALLVVPQFCNSSFPGWEGYNLGRMSESGLSQNETAFAVLERIFDYVRQATASNSHKYLIYGHSAGAQFVHRLVLLHEQNRAHIAVAANAGWYTLPTHDIEFPYGLANYPFQKVDLRRAFRKRLVILLGKTDTDQRDENLRRTIEAQMQGVHRLQRGHTKFRIAKSVASRLEAEFSWEMRVLPGIGHSNRAIAKHAAHILFSRQCDSVNATMS